MKQLDSLENGNLRVGVTQAGKGVSIHSIYNKVTGKEWIATDYSKISSRTNLKTYDEQYFGGCEFIFPNDYQAIVNQITFPDHGYLWTADFKFEGRHNTEEEIALRYTGFIKELKVKIAIEIALAHVKSEVRLSIVLSNESNNCYPYLLRLHPSFNVNEETKFHFNGRKILFEGEEKPSYCSFYTENLEQDYPIITTDKGSFSIEEMTSANQKEVFCHIKQEKPGFIIHDGDGQLKVYYPHKDFPYLTIYYIQGGSHIIMIEPDTGISADLNLLIDRKEEETLAPYQERQYVINIEVI